MLKAVDYSSDQDVRWCPGCGDYSILKQVQSVLAEFEAKRESTVFISGIGCSSRFPYYLNTYGMHGIHGRATAIASGLRAVRRDLDIWVITGDGDGLSIGLGHLLHALRRNFRLKILLFNNEIYGLTKGQYSPTTPEGHRTKSSPMGVIDHPFNPLALALGADATFVARTMDRDPLHLRDVLKAAHAHEGSAFIEVYQNCNVFNDGAFFAFTDKKTKANNTVYLEAGKPMVFGENNDKVLVKEHCGIAVDTLENAQHPLVHNPGDLHQAMLLSRMFDLPETEMEQPRPFGVLYQTHRPCYEDLMQQQIQQAVEKNGAPDLDALLAGDTSWEVH
ncbi:MAG: 2-oxoacid:ferredoxin oxidoreductase subunit beta [Cryomorphaceae bacterium]|nr:2-oxoacid:ferredoxin oxidoreductase subunit beta [Cryomorphaceae bacterium]